ncbi:MAG: hypothetical protein WAQ29_09070, partial [Nitrososphaeraceae archaeon]
SPDLYRYYVTLDGIFYLLNSTSINSLQKMSSLTIEGFLIVISSSNSLLWYWSFPSVQPYDN